MCVCVCVCVCVCDSNEKTLIGPYANRKAQISMCIHSFEPQRVKTNLLTRTPNEDSNKSAHPCNLIRVFFVRVKKLCILAYPKCAQWRFWSACAKAQADLNLRRALISEGTFWDVVAFLNHGLLCSLLYSCTSISNHFVREQSDQSLHCLHNAFSNVAVYLTGLCMLIIIVHSDWFVFCATSLPVDRLIWFINVSPFLQMQYKHFIYYIFIFLVLLNQDIHCLCKQCSSRSMATELDLHCLSFSM